jgi:molybdopterin-guanine dinucleotide biosynthesis protein A
MARPPSVAGVILAGGQARRMGGGDKGRTQVAGRSILDWQLEILRPQVAALAINANGPAERFAETGLPVIADDPGAEGPLAGILTALEWAAAEGFSRVLTVPCDTPFVPPDLVLRLGRHTAAVAASQGNIHPVIGLWPVVLANDLRRLVIDAGERKARVWVQRCGAVSVEWPGEPFTNVNCAQDRLEAERLCCQRGNRSAASVTGR